MRRGLGSGKAGFRAFLIGAAISIAQLGLAADVAVAMDQYASNNRPLVIFAPHKRYPAFMRQQRYLSGRGSRIRERDIVVVLVVGDRVSSQYGAKPTLTAAELRKTYDVNEGAYSMVLVGKDTGVKHRFDGPVTAGQLFSRVDAMPLRQQEMRAEPRS